MIERLGYWRRIAGVYLLPRHSALTFWHETPAASREARFDVLGPYYQTFADKARYPGPFDENGVPLLDYHGGIGRQYNPIAVAQYGLAHYNLFRRTGDQSSRDACLAQADWLASNLEKNTRGLSVWLHKFDFEYRTTLRSPWYSGLAQGQGLSLLARAHQLTGDDRYETAMRAAFEALSAPTNAGGTLFIDEHGSPWIEEYVVEPPTHILNGFVWALWGVRDYAMALDSAPARDFFSSCVETLEANLARYDTGYWSLYELSGTQLPMLASPFYHRLHIVQLRILAAMTGRMAFENVANRWEDYAAGRFNRVRSLLLKAAFKVFYY